MQHIQFTSSVKVHKVCESLQLNVAHVDEDLHCNMAASDRRDRLSIDFNWNFVLRLSLVSELEHNAQQGMYNYYSGFSSDRAGN